MSGSADLTVCPQPAALAPASCPERHGCDPALLRPGDRPATLQDGFSSFHERISSDKPILESECELCLRFPLIHWGSERGSDSPRDESGS